MATYKGIQGYSVQKLSSDPTVADVEGQLWYNSTLGKFKIAVAGAGAWESGGSLNQPRAEAAGIGTKAAALAAGGNITPSLASESETYDGTSWAEGNDINSARRNARGSGTTTAGMIVGGWGTPAGINATEYYDGTSWTTQTGTLTRGGGYQENGIAGASQTSAIFFGGVPGTTYFKYSETWDGTSWSEGNNLNTGRVAPGGAGIVTAALCIAGNDPGITNVESYDGTCWTETATDINTGRQGGGSSGTSTACTYYGGWAPPNSALTESFDGSTWTEVGDLATARVAVGGTLSPTSLNTSALAIGGSTGPPTRLAICEEYSDPVYAAKTVTLS
jgi:hypothetical protein